MRVSRLFLSGFRSYEEGCFDFVPGINLITGENGAGKTNLLEAVYILSGNRSFRGAKSAEFVNFTKERADISAAVFSRGREFEMKLSFFRAGKGKVFINDVNINKKSKMSEIIRSVIFSPKDLMLIKGAAAERRGFLDGALCQKSGAYSDALSKYEKVLSWKQKLLRDEGDLSVLPELDAQLAKYGAEIIESRASFISETEKTACRIHSEISGGKEKLSLTYKTVSAVKDPFCGKEKLSSLLFDRFSEMRDAEIRKQACLTGVQKDDVEVYINGTDAKAFASQGQSRTAAVALKFSEREFLKEEGEYPLLLLDDVMSELDAPRQEYIAGTALNGQTFITCCETTGNSNPDKIIKITR